MAKSRVAATQPRRGYHEALSCWFLYQGHAYNVELCSQELFTAFVEAATPEWSAHERANRLVLDSRPGSRDLLLERWYSLEELSFARVKFTLYPSELEALKALRGEPLGVKVSTRRTRRRNTKRKDAAAAEGTACSA